MNNVNNLEIIQCPCCPKAQSKLWADEGRGTQYRTCCACGTVFASPRSARETLLPPFKESWGKKTALRIAAMRQQALERIAATIQAYKPAGRLLDCGCSSGAFFNNFDKAQWECQGVELSPTAAEYAAESTGAIVHTGTLISAKYQANYFDVVTIIDAFYYFDDPLEQLQEAARVLKRDGVLAIEIPGGTYSRARSRGPMCLLLNRKWYRMASDSNYLFIYSAKGFKHLVQRAGFRLLAFDVMPSPQTLKWTDILNKSHYTLLRKLVRHWPQLVDCSPKVLWIFQKS